MALTIRKRDIIDVARREGMVSVEDLVARLDVSAQTIRRDLAELADEGRLERVHGGAVLPSNTTNIAYLERQELNQGAKAAIAQECARRIPNNSSVFLNIGTTTEAVAMALAEHTGMLVVTNNLNIATKFSHNDRIEVIVTGGTLRKADGGLVGTLARQTVSQFRFDYAVIGCSALHPDGDILDFDTREVGVSQAALERTETVIVAADGAKFTRKAPVKIASLFDVATFVTDLEVPSDLVDRCRVSGTSIVRVTDA